MDARLLAALVSSIICEVAILLLLLNNNSEHSSSSSASASFTSLWPILIHIFQSSQSVAAALMLEDQPSNTRAKRRRLMLRNTTDDDEDEDEEVFNGHKNVFFSRSDSGFMEAASFKANFKMSPTTFEWLCKQLEPLLERRDNNKVEGGLSLNNVTVGERVGMGLFRLATGSSYAGVSQRFGTTEPIARLCAKQLYRVLCTNFKFWVAYPPPSALHQVMAEFQTISGLPNCCGAIDCTRFKITMQPTPEDNNNDSRTRNTNNNGTNSHFNHSEDDSDLLHSVVTQIVVDCSSRILSIITGFNGDKGDSRVLRSSTLYSDVQEGRLLNSPPLYLKGISVPQYLVGDSGYPLLPWLMVPYTDPVVTSCEEDFNSKHYLMRQAALRTLACLRKWGILSKPIVEHVRIGVACIGACAILHNILLTREDGAAVLEGTEDYALHDQSSQYYRDANKEEYSIEKKASVIRNALAVKAREMQSSEQAIPFH